jgi:mono/diheme cytochrome c family protein
VKLILSGLATVVIIGIGVVLFTDDAFGFLGQSGGQLLAYEDPDVIALGKAVYADQCASCHGADLGGQENWRDRGDDGLLPAPPHDASGHTWHHDDALLIRIVTEGTEAVVGGGYQSAMMGFADVMTDADILDVLAYIKSTWPDEAQRIHNDINARMASNG